MAEITTKKKGGAKKGAKQSASLRKYKKFVDEYFVDFKQKDAAIRAGYSQKSASRIAYDLMQLPEVKEMMSQKLAERKAQVLYDEQNVVEALMETRERCMRRRPVMVFDYKEKAMVQKQDEDDNGTSTGVWEFDSMGANRASELLGKHIGMFDTKLTLKNDPNNPLPTPIVNIQITQIQEDDATFAEKPASPSTDAGDQVAPKPTPSPSVQPAPGPVNN